MKDALLILRRNFMQPIVVAIFILAATLLFFGQNRDALFISSVIFINTIGAVIQEMRARRALKKLELMSAPHARRINDDGTVSNVVYTDLAAEDMVDIRLGDEVPADGVVVSSQGLEINESMLTGESASIAKNNEETVYASSSVVAGSAIMRVTAVGDATRVGGMTKVLKRYEPKPTALQQTIALIIALTTYGALVLAALIFVVYFFSGQDPVTIVKTITAAAVTVVPEGLLLASTLLLAFGSLRLAQAKVLPQKLTAIEAMALLDMLCVDKTGTLTSDTIQFSKLDVWKAAPKNLDELLGIIAFETSSGNATADAMIAGLPHGHGYTVNNRLPFSSERKYSGGRIEVNNKVYTVMLGAPEFLDTLAPLSAKQKEKISDYTKRGQRVLLAAVINDQKTDLKQLKPGSGTAAGLVVLTNELRTGVTKTVHYLQANDVTMKVMSGDNPDTVRYVARQAGIHRAEKVITGAELATLKGKQWGRAARQYTIFSRVLPEQKEQLIKQFQKDNQFTGMVGDGVNDALALKRADLGVAMFAGAAATRRVADIVLLNNSFNALPLGMKLGNRTMLAIEMIATLFFHKIIYAVVLLITTLIVNVTYPFEPRHITFMNIFLVTTPTILWTLFSPIPTYRVSPKHFWKETLLPVAPIAMITGVTVVFSYLLLRARHPHNAGGVTTTTVLIATFFGIYLVFLMGKMFRVKNNRTAKLARILYILVVIAALLIIFGIGIIRNLFDFTIPAYQNARVVLIAVIAAAALQWLIADRIAKYRAKTNVKAVA